ncbi:hypothetical protein D3C83_183580 [compost metagenome]
MAMSFLTYALASSTVCKGMLGGLPSRVLAALSPDTNVLGPLILPLLIASRCARLHSVGSCVSATVVTPYRGNICGM